MTILCYSRTSINLQTPRWYVEGEQLTLHFTQLLLQVPANNGSGNYFMGRPDGWQTMTDEGMHDLVVERVLSLSAIAVFVVTLLKTAGTLTVSSGSNVRTFSAPAGASIYTVPMGVGQQTFALARNGVNALAAVSLKDIVNTCVCGTSAPLLTCSEIIDISVA